MKKRSNNQHNNRLWTIEILNLVVGVVLSVLSFSASPNAVYSARAIVCHLISASVSQTTVNQVSQSNRKAATEGAIRYRLRKLDLEGAQCTVNQMLKSKAIKTLPRRALTFAIDFASYRFTERKRMRGIQ